MTFNISKSGWIDPSCNDI